MRLTIKRKNDGEYIADRPLYLNADKTKAVEEDDPEARFVLAGEGGTIPAEYRDLVKIEEKPSAKEEKEEGTEAKAVTAAPQNKAVAAPDKRK